MTNIEIWKKAETAVDKILHNLFECGFAHEHGKSAMQDLKKYRVDMMVDIYVSMTGEQPTRDMLKDWVT